MEGSFHLRRPVIFDDIVARQAVSRCGASCGPRVTSSASRVVGIVSRWRASGTRGTRVTHALECTLLVIREDIPVAVRHAQRVDGMPSVLPSVRIADARELYCRQPSPAVINRLPLVPLRPWVTPWSIHGGSDERARWWFPKRKKVVPVDPWTLNTDHPVGLLWSGFCCPYAPDRLPITDGGAVTALWGCTDEL